MKKDKTKKTLPRIVIDSVEKDDWIKLVNPKAALEEIEIHEELAKKFAEENRKKK